MRVSIEVDYHGFTAVEMRRDLDYRWTGSAFRGAQRVRVIHGRGEVLGQALRSWCDEARVTWAPDPGNPGSTILHPAASQRVQPLSPPPKRTAKSQPRAMPPRTNEEPPIVHKTPAPDDPMEQEFDRLSSECADVLQRRKRQ